MMQEHKSTKVAAASAGDVFVGDSQQTLARLTLAHLLHTMSHAETRFITNVLSRALLIDSSVIIRHWFNALVCSDQCYVPSIQVPCNTPPYS